MKRKSRTPHSFYNALASGFTIIEAVVVVALVSTLALFSVNSIVSFQKTALLDNAVAEFTSALRDAQNQSVSGKLLNGEEAADFEENGLPMYGIELNSDEYSLFREKEFVGEGSTRDTLETYKFDCDITVAPVPDEVIFSRLTGTTSGATYIFQSGGNIKEVVIESGGRIFVNTL